MSILKRSSLSYGQNTFLDLYILALDEIFLIGISHRVDDFNLKVICFPFSDSNFTRIQHTEQFIYNWFVTIDFVTILKLFYPLSQADYTW